MSKHKDETAARKSLNWFHNNDAEQVENAMQQIRDYQKSLKSEDARLPGKNGEILKLDKEIKEDERAKSFLGKLGKN